MRIAEMKRKKVKKSVKKRPVPRFLLPVVPVVPSVPRGWLLSHDGIPYAVSTFLEGAGKKFTEIYKTIIAKKQRQKQYFLRYNSYSTFYPAIPLLNIFMQVAVKNQKLIRTFRCIARRFMRSKLTMKNTEDLVTGDIPVTPVWLVDWRSRSKYVFEARTLLRDIVTRLTMSYCDFFPGPKMPRNPYTNEDLTEGQFYSVAQQLKAVGQSHWAIDALYTAKYNLDEFERDMYSKIKRTIHNSIFANPGGDLAKRILLEYIEEEHEHHIIPYEADIYTWAVENLSHHFSIHKWRIQCAKYYSIVHFPTEKAKDDVEKEKIDEATKILCAYPVNLVEKYESAKEKKYVKVEDRRTATSYAIQTYISAYVYEYGGEEETETETETEEALLEPLATLFTDDNDSPSEAD